LHISVVQIACVEVSCSKNDSRAVTRRPHDDDDDLGQNS